jgi:hypothetical protein
MAVRRERLFTWSGDARIALSLAGECVTFGSCNTRSYTAREDTSSQVDEQALAYHLRSSTYSLLERHLGESSAPQESNGDNLNLSYSDAAGYRDVNIF